jgi:hypothetical protein
MKFCLNTNSKLITCDTIASSADLCQLYISKLDEVHSIVRHFDFLTYESLFIITFVGGFNSETVSQSNPMSSRF